MSFGLFIMLNDEKSLKCNIKYGFYGAYMTPISEIKLYSNYFKILSDYACCVEGTEIFFFNERKITYGGRVTKKNDDNPVFYLNGNTSHLGIKANSKKYIDIGEILEKTDEDGVYINTNNKEKEEKKISLPFIIEFDNNSELSGKQIISDELYFKLSNYNFPFPSNSVQGRGMCTLTQKETEILINLIKESDEKIDLRDTKHIDIDDDQKLLFKTLLIENEEHITESHLEFLLLAKFNTLKEIVVKAYPHLINEDYIKCRQVPLCPFKPMHFDLADICLYSKKNTIKNGSIPNIIIELKKEKGNFKAYEQVTKYLRWVDKITSDDEFRKVNAIIIAPEFTRNLSYKFLENKKISLKYKDKIKLYSLKEDKIIHLS